MMHPMPDSPRLPVLDAADDPRLEELFGKALRGPDGSVLNIFGTLGNHPDLLRRWLVFATHVLVKSTLTPRDRELLILRTGWNCRSRYEFAQHVLIARECGISNDEIARVRLGPDEPGWSPADRLLLVAADQLHAEQSLSEETWLALAAERSPEQILDLIATVGNYHLVAMFLNSARVELDGWVREAVLEGGTEL